MAFLCELGLALGKTLTEVYALSAAEISVWLAYRKRHGFPADRIANGVAIGASYTGAVWGGKANPAELVARFHRSKQPDDVAGVKAWFDALMPKKGA